MQYDLAENVFLSILQSSYSTLSLLGIVSWINESCKNLFLGKQAIISQKLPVQKQITRSYCNEFLLFQEP